MQFQLSFLCLLAIGVRALEVTPTAKVVTLLNGMLEKGKAEKIKEQVAYAAAQQFCDDRIVSKKSRITDEKERILGLSAEIGQETAVASRLGREFTDLNVDEATWTGDKKAANEVRLIEFTDYQTTHADYTSAIDAVGRAVAVLKKQTHDRSQASFAQVSALQDLNLIPDTAKRAIDAFVQTGYESSEADLTGAAPEANGYEFQSNGVVDMLEKLQSKFIDEKTQLEKEEANSKHASELLTAGLGEQIVQAQTDEGRKTVAKGETLAEKAMDTSDKNEEADLKKVDEEFLRVFTSDCAMAASNYASRQQLRSEEVVAIEKAIEILSGDMVAGAAVKHLPSFLQKKTSSLSQLRFSVNSQIQARLSTFLHAQAKLLNSAVLEAVAARASADPFSKVKKMIKDLVVRLMEEANEESDHKGWCDTELSTNEQTRKEKSESVEMLHAEIDELKASISQLGEDMVELAKSVADLDQGMATATEQRQKEKKSNEATIKDASDAQTAVAQALVVLKEFYAKAGESTALVQRQPEVFDSPYRGMGAESGGVVGMLEVIESDFARLSAETSSAEVTAQKTYDEFMSDSKVDKAQKSTESGHKTAKKQDQEQALTVKSADLDGTQKELDAALTYYDKLKPSCVDSGVSFDDRVSRRKEEIESLQEALKILNGESI